MLPAAPLCPLSVVFKARARVVASAERPRVLAVLLAVAAAAISGEGVFIARVMTCVACVASPIACLVAMEMVELLFAAPRQRSSVPVVGIIPVVNMAVKAAWAMEPATSANEHSAIKPIGAVVAVGRAAVWGVVEVPIGAYRLHSNTDGDLGWRHAHTAEQGSSENCASKGFHFGHVFSFVRSGIRFRVSR